jgi:hypothetical protein
MAHTSRFLPLDDPMGRRNSFDKPDSSPRRGALPALLAPGGPPLEGASVA